MLCINRYKISATRFWGAACPLKMLAPTEKSSEQPESFHSVSVSPGAQAAPSRPGQGTKQDCPKLKPSF